MIASPMRWRPAAALLAVTLVVCATGACSSAIRSSAGTADQAEGEGYWPDEDLAQEAPPAPGAYLGGAAALATPALYPEISLTATPGLAATPEPDAGGNAAGTAAEGAGAAAAIRKIIKDGTITLEVDDVQAALSRLDALAVQSGGYVIETSTDYSNPFWRRAFMRMAVPVDQFEAAMQRIREGAGKVLGEQASGVDVSQEFVDVQSQIANLEATQARVRQLLAEADTVEEALSVNAELTRIEGQLGQLKGRLQYLQQRSAYSTIAISLQEPEPEPTITPTPTATPTPTPPDPWRPGDTAQAALGSMRLALRALGDLLIWVVLGALPVLLVLALPVALVVWAIRGRRRPRP